MITVTAKTLGICFLIITPSLILLEIINKKILFRKRKKITLEEIFLNEIKNKSVSKNVFFDVYRALEKFYGINAKLIRPSDPWKKFLDIGSWRLDTGNEGFNNWLVKNYELHPNGPKINTVMDLLIMVEKAKKKIR